MVKLARRRRSPNAVGLKGKFARYVFPVCGDTSCPSGSGFVNDWLVRRQFAGEVVGGTQVCVDS